MSARAVYSLIVDLLDGGDLAFPVLAGMARELGIPLATAETAVAGLLSSGRIGVNHRTGKYYSR